MSTEAELQKAKLLRLLRRLTPFVWVFFICIVLIIFGYIQANETDGWSFLVIFLAAPVAFGTLIVDYILKAVITEGYLKLWLIEILIGILGVVIFTYPK
jgi:hypothetical protein